MYTKILVPMDGSEIAECVVPTVEWFAKVSNVKEIVILRVIEPLHLRNNLERHFSLQERRHLEQDELNIAKSYCVEISARLNVKKSTRVKPEALVGKPAETITEYVSIEKEIDLIIMATHGRSGVGRLLHGSTADKVLHDAIVPVLMVTPHDRNPK